MKRNGEEGELINFVHLRSDGLELRCVNRLVHRWKLLYSMLLTLTSASTTHCCFRSFHLRCLHCPGLLDADTQQRLFKESLASRVSVSVLLKEDWRTRESMVVLFSISSLYTSCSHCFVSHPFPRFCNLPVSLFSLISIPAHVSRQRKLDVALTALHLASLCFLLYRCLSYTRLRCYCVGHNGTTHAHGFTLFIQPL